MKVFLVGYMGVGKSTVAGKLAPRLGLEALDLDELMERAEGCSVSEIFRLHGETYFRELEARLLLETLQRANFVLALGGGAPLHGQNMDVMLAAGVVVRLTLPLPKLVSRLKQGIDHRPLLAGQTEDTLADFVSAHLLERTPCYARAHIHFDVSDFSADKRDRLVEAIWQAHRQRR